MRHSHLLERVDEYAADLSERVLIIADEVDQQDVYRRQLWRFQRTGTTGYRHRVLTQIIDTIHFAPSNASRLVQAADLVAYLNCRIRSRADTDERAKKANKMLWEILEPQVLHCYRWVP